MNNNTKNKYYGYTIALICLLALIIGCSVPEKYAKRIDQDIENDMGVNGTKLRLFLQTGSDIKSILSWEHFLTFKNFDVIAVDTGIIRAATVTSKSVILPGQTVTPSVFLDANTMGFDGGIFLCCTNYLEISGSGLHFGNSDITINGYAAFNLNSGLPFTLDSNVNASVVAKFKIYGIAAGVETELVPDEYSITFYTAHHTNTSIAPLKNVSNSDLVETTTKDTLFTKLLNELQAYEKYARLTGHNSGTDVFSSKLLHKDEDGDGTDSFHIKTIDDSLMAVERIVIVNSDLSTITNYVYNPLLDKYYMYAIGDTVPVGVSEKSMVHASAQNAKVILANRLIQMIDKSYPFPATDDTGGVLKTIPSVGPQMDSYFGLYSNISGLLEVLNDFRDGYVLKKDNSNDQLQKNLLSYLKSVVGIDDLGKLNPSAFSHFILWYSDYLLYAGLCSYLDNDFYSRYINYHNLLLDEVKTLIDKVAIDYDNNNIVLRFYAAGAFYDMILGKDRGYLQGFTDRLEKYVDNAGEYGEGFAYLGYLSEVVLPVLYVGLQETYLQGSKSGQHWLPDTSRVITQFRKIAQNLSNVVSNWGELPALDDGSPVIPYLAPYSVITGESKYLQYTKDIRKLLDSGMYNNLESPERVSMDGNAPWRMFLYPYNKSFTETSDWKHPLDSIRKSGSIVQIPTGNANDLVNMSVIAEENPQAGGTHDQIDHGAIQLTRYKSSISGGDPHVDHLIIDPGYPGFQDNKRFLNEWKYCNQNVQMLWDSEFSDTAAYIPFDAAKVYIGDDELLGYKDDVDFSTTEKMNYKENGGMTGYRYMSVANVRDMLHRYVLNNHGIQDNVDGIAEVTAMQKIGAKILSPLSGEGKSQVINQYKNGVEIKINYKYPKTQGIATKEASILGLWPAKYYYSRGITYEESHYGIRGIYTLGNNYFVIDQLPEDNLPSTISLATSWNMPKNTTQMGNSGWQQFVFEGTTPDSSKLIDPSNPSSPKYISESRIELAIAGANNVDSKSILFQTHQSKNDTIRTTHLTFENTSQSKPFIVTAIRVKDISQNFPSIQSQLEDITTVNGGIIWIRNYTDNSKDFVVYNPEHKNQTLQGITSDANVWLLHANSSGNWSIGNLFNATGSPSFSGFSSTPTVTLCNSVDGSGGQYEITF